MSKGNANAQAGHKRKLSDTVPTKAHAKPAAPTQSAPKSAPQQGKPQQNKPQQGKPQQGKPQQQKQGQQQSQQKKKPVPVEESEDDDEFDEEMDSDDLEMDGSDLEDDLDEDLEEDVGSDSDAGDADAASGEEDLDTEIADHKAQLEALKESDPEFYKHLLESDKDLLKFGDDEPTDDQSDDEDTSAELDAAEDEDGADQKKSKNTEPLTSESLKKLEQQCLQEHSLRALKRLLKIFHTAAHSVQSQKSDAAASSAKTKQMPNTKKAAPAKGLIPKGDDDSMKSVNVRLHDRVISFCLKHMDKILDHHVPTEKKDGAVVVSTSTAAWRKIGPYVKSYLSNLLHVSPLLISERLLRMVCAHMSKLRHMFSPFTKLQNKLAKLMLDYFSTGEELVRIDAFLLIRTMALHGNQQMVDNLLKQTYLHFVRNAKFYNKNSAPTITLMANCVVDLYSLFPRTAYQFAFVYLRQLAIHLRNALLNKAKQHADSVYNWQFMNCLRLFAMLLSNSCHSESASAAATAGANANNVEKQQESELYPLVYPFVQICVSVMELAPNVRYYPLRFMCARLLNQVCRATGVFVPLTPHLLPVLQMAQLEKQTKSLIKGKVSSFEYNLHVSKTLVVSKGFQDYALTETLRLLLQHFACYSYSIAFPELIVPAVLQLKKFVKSTKVLRFSKQAQALIHQLEQQATWTQQRRNTIDVAPAQVTSVNYFRSQGGAPLESYAKQMAAAAVEEGSVKSKRQLDAEGEGSDESGDDDGDDVEEEVKEPSTKKAKQPKAAKPAPPTSNDVDDVQDFEDDFSDDE